MWRRCTDTRREDYERYGAKGISVCERWRTFGNFLIDMGERPAGLTLERKNNKGNYEPDNCVWATRAEQNTNKGLYKNSSSGIAGVSYDRASDTWLAYITRQGRRERLFRGANFFDACCARKSWESKNVGH